MQRLQVDLLAGQTLRPIPQVTLTAGAGLVVRVKGAGAGEVLGRALR